MAVLRAKLGQGAAEYLVLLAAVLIIALVSVALLGFFPGTASDAQHTESRSYWLSTAPIAITEAVGMGYLDQTVSQAYMRIRNTGNYPIRITKILGNGRSISLIVIGWNGSDWVYGNISDYFYFQPGEERYFGRCDRFEVPGYRLFSFGTGWAPVNMSSQDSLCGGGNGTSYIVMRNFGFEYVQYVEGLPITKRQVGTAPLIIRCIPWKSRSCS